MSGSPVWYTAVVDSESNKFTIIEDNSCLFHLSVSTRAVIGQFSGPHSPVRLRAFAHHVVCCCVLLRLVGSCWMKFETGQTSAPTSANISIVSRSSNRGPTMLGSFALHIQQSCTGARALHASQP